MPTNELEPIEVNMNTMLSDAVEAIAELGKQNADASFRPETTILFQDEDHVHRVNHLDPNSPAVIDKFPRPRAMKNLEFYSRESFCAAVTNEDQRRQKAKTILEAGVFVHSRSVDARWNLSGHEARDTFTMPLDRTVQFATLEKLGGGVTRKELWKLLATSLHGCFPAALEMQIASLQVIESRKEDITIHASGLAGGSESSEIILEYTDPNEGNKKKKVAMDWEFTGPVWTCFLEPVSIPCRLTIEKSANGVMVFQFHPRGMEAILLAHRQNLVGKIQESLTAAKCGIPVYQGDVVSPYNDEE